MRENMVRYGKFPGTWLGLGTIANANLAGSKLYFNIITATSSATQLQLTQGQTKLAAIYFWDVRPYGTHVDVATASLEFLAKDIATSGYITTGTIKFKEKTGTLAHNVRCVVFLIGPGDPDRLPT